MAATASLPALTADPFEPRETADLLRFTTAGSVDDGKSTLIGRLLYDSRNVYEDQIESVGKASVGRNAGPLDFSLLTDGLRAEREQGITIDVAHRYFATAKRKFIIADTPGHEQYTRNMVTGASTAQLAIVLIDARKGLLPQSRRHAYIASLLGLQHLVVAVNKMDLVDYNRDVFSSIERDFREFLQSAKGAEARHQSGKELAIGSGGGRDTAAVLREVLESFQSLEPFFIPISALAGDNVVHRSSRMAWFEGPSLLEYLEQVPVNAPSSAQAFRFPVQRVVRPNAEFRGYAGTVASGHVRLGDTVVALPSGRSTQIASIGTFDGELASAEHGQAITLTLADDIDLSRGDVIASAVEPPALASTFRATLVWLNEAPAKLDTRYRLKHAARQDWAQIRHFDYRVNINTLAEEPTTALAMNAIAVAQIETARPLAFDPYSTNRQTGSFILIDPATNATVAAGMIREAIGTRAQGLSAAGEFEWKIEGGALHLTATAGRFEASAGSSGAFSDPRSAALMLELLKLLQIDIERKSQ